MEHKEWKVDVDGTEHTVALNWTYWSGHRQVLVDGKVADDNSFPMKGGSEQLVQVGSKSATVRTKAKSKLSPYFVVTLELDGTVVAPVSGSVSKWEREAA